MANWIDSELIIDACENGEFDTVKLLIEKGCDIEARDEIDQRPIHIACANGHVDIVQLLIERKCDIEARDKFDWRPIHFACANGHVDIVQLLIEHKCDIEARDDLDRRPIHFACANGHVDIVQLLIERKCDIEARDKFGWRPIHYACYKGHVDIVQLLIERKCYIEARDENYCRPIHYACANGHVDIVQLLIEHKCDIEARDKDDQRPIHIACWNGHVDIVQLLIEHKCDIEAHHWIDQRPIHKACANGRVDIVQLLIEHKCDIEARDKYDKRPIHIACANGHVDIVQLLIERKCDIEANNENNWRPIHFAIRFGHVAIVELLIAHHCDMNAITKENKSPMSIAVQYKHKQLINVIKKLFKEKLAVQIKRVSNVKCGTGCDHKSCPRNLILTDSQTKIVIGRGSFGEVYKLRDQETKLEYALKVIQIYSECTKKRVKNLEDDINRYRDIIKHPRIMEYLGSLSYAKKIYIFMDYFPKGSLEAEIQKAGFLEHQRILRYTKQILEGVEFLHDKKVIHGDIKPSNILLDDNDNMKLCNFGTSKQLQSISIGRESFSDKQNKIIKANTFCGFINYTAPEVFSVVPYSFPADIWSVGASIVHMLTGQPPYLGRHTTNVIYKIMIEKKIEFEPREPMSDNMQLFVKETLNPDPSKRATAKELLQFLIDHDMISDSDSTDTPKEL